MLSPLEPFFCPCCTSALLHTLAQTGLPPLKQSLNILGTQTLSRLLHLEAAGSPVSTEAE